MQGVQPVLGRICGLPERLHLRTGQRAVQSIGGQQVGIAGHLVIGDRVRIAAQSGIGSNIGDGETVQGSPAFKKSLHDRSFVVYRNLPDLKRRIDGLEKELAELRAYLNDATRK